MVTNVTLIQDTVVVQSDAKLLVQEGVRDGLWNRDAVPVGEVGGLDEVLYVSVNKSCSRGYQDLPTLRGLVPTKWHNLTVAKMAEVTRCD